MEIAAQYGREKGLEWFPSLYKKDIMVLGQGGIGSWATLMLSRIGCNLYTYDNDYFEEHNMTGQAVRAQDINKRKSNAVADLSKEFSPDATIIADGLYTEQSPVNNIMICGFDNMPSRILTFAKWSNYVLGLPLEERKRCFFQDGRLNAEQLQIFNIPGDDSKLIDEYSTNHLFDGTEVPPQECTAKQTTHCAGMIAGHMVGFLTNWVVNSESDFPIRAVPPYYEYLVPVNLTT